MELKVGKTLWYSVNEIISFAAKAEDESTLFCLSLSLLAFLGLSVLFVCFVCVRFLFEGETGSLPSVTAIGCVGFHRLIRSCTEKVFPSAVDERIKG